MPPTSSRLRAPIRSSGVFALELALAGSGLIAVAVAVTSSVKSFEFRSAAGGRHLEVLHQRFTYPYANVAAVVVVVVAVVGLAVLVRGVRAGLRVHVGQRRLLRDIALRDPRLRGAMIVVEGARPEAFCAGLLRPRVYVSSGALHALDANQLRAVLAHEEHHRRRRDPMRLAVIRVLGTALFFLPVLTALSDRYCSLAELSADDAAVHAGGGPAVLAGAMLAFRDSAHPVGTVGIAAERIDRLMGREVAWRLPLLLVGCAAATTTLLVGFAWQIGRDALVETTLSPPFFSRQPCIVVLALLPGLLAVAAVVVVRRWAAQSCTLSTGFDNSIVSVGRNDDLVVHAVAGDSAGPEPTGALAGASAALVRSPGARQH